MASIGIVTLREISYKSFDEGHIRKLQRLRLPSQSGREDGLATHPKIQIQQDRNFEDMGNTPAEAYESFEDDFDGSETLAVFQELRGYLLLLEERAQCLPAKPPGQGRKLNPT